MTATLTMNGNNSTRKTLASQLDRLDGILDGLDAALSGAVQEAVGLAVQQAVQAVLTEVLTNRDLQEQLRQSSTDAAAAKPPRKRPSLPQRLWQAAVQGVQRTVQTVRQVGRRASVALLATAGLAVGVAYAARQRLASAAAAAYRIGKRMFAGAVTTLTCVLPSLALSTR